MVTIEQLLNQTDKLSIIGLGYVGLPLAQAFSEHIQVIGYDSNTEKIIKYQKIQSRVVFTDDPNQLAQARFHIVAVPTPVTSDKRPDLCLLKQASKQLAQRLKQGSVVVYESTVYPGVTEEICIPILEQASGLVCGQDFTVGYSPERINPGDKNHCLNTIVKVISAVDEQTLDLIEQVYRLVVYAGLYRAESIRIAEVAKLIENTQRDLNIALINELSMILGRMNLDTQAVLRAAGTKWNFEPYQPGLVGGHCIGIDPYYLTYKAEQLGCCSKIVDAARLVNESMGCHVAQNAVKQLTQSGQNPVHARVGILGFAFKENCGDIRNTKVMDIIHELRAHQIEPMVVDPLADCKQVSQEYGIVLCDFSELHDLDSLIVAVAHDVFKRISYVALDELFARSKNIVDVKGIYNKLILEQNGYQYWRL